MRRPVDVKAHFRFLSSFRESVPIQLSRPCRHPSIRTLCERIFARCQVGVLGIFSSSLCKLPSPSPQITVFSKRSQNVVCSLHHHRSQIPVSFLADFLLWFALTGVPPARF